MPLLPIISRPIPDHRRPYSCYRLDLPGGVKDRPRTTAEDALESLQERQLLCKLCSAPVTRQKEAVSKNGLHEHVFFNPSGITFEIRCFLRAPGCSVEGEPTTAFSWFSGYSWQYGLCSTCLAHLGWRFTAANDSFFALISNRLME